MAQQYASGSVHVFCAYNPPGGPASGPFYLGTCEQMPQDNRNPEYELLMNDISGSKKPLDLAWEGEDATISLVLTRFSHVGWNLLETKPFPTANVNGEWDIEDVGALMGLEGICWSVWLVYSFGSALANKAAYTTQGMPPGRFYPQCVVWAPMADETGSRPMKRQVIFYAWPKLVTTAANVQASQSQLTNPTDVNAAKRSFVLYSTALASFSGLPAIT